MIQVVGSKTNTLAAKNNMSSENTYSTRFSQKRERWKSIDKTYGNENPKCCPTFDDQEKPRDSFKGPLTPRFFPRPGILDLEKNMILAGCKMHGE